MPTDGIEIFRRNKIIPIAVLNNPEDALRISELLLEHSISVLEITLRTITALACINAVAKKFPEITVGAGSILSLDAFKSAEDAGSRFFVAPCLDTQIMDYSYKNRLTFIPGVATPTEINLALSKCSIIKIFPVSQLGGPEYIRAVAAPFKMKDFSIMPTGGINEKNYLDYLSIDRVVSVGMSYPVDEKLIASGDFGALGERMKSIISGLPGKGA